MTERYPSGLVINYPYLWRWQDEIGRENAEKDRPACLAITLADPKEKYTHLVILPISGTQPSDAQTALEIPMLELRRAGLSTLKRGWITVSEFNYDIAERSYYFEPNQKPRGQFSARFLEDIRKALRPVLSAHAAKVDRTK